MPTLESDNFYTNRLIIKDIAKAIEEIQQNRDLEEDDEIRADEI
jgi:hypothetical protein